jgi:hypothetical protein
MASIDFQEVEQFAQLFPAGGCPKFPQAVTDLAALNQTQQAMVRTGMPQLWERLHGGAENHLPADVLLRMHKKQLQHGDEEHLRAAGLEAAAIELNQRLRDEEIARMEARMIADMEARAEANEQARARNEMARMESAQISQLQLAKQNRGF